MCIASYHSQLPERNSLQRLHCCPVTVKYYTCTQGLPPLSRLVQSLSRNLVDECPLEFFHAMHFSAWPASTCYYCLPRPRPPSLLPSLAHSAIS